MINKMKSKKNLKELINVLETKVGTPLQIGTDYNFSSLQFCATVYYFPKNYLNRHDIDEHLKEAVDSGKLLFGKDYSLAFYNKEMEFGIPYDFIYKVDKVHNSLYNLTAYEITVFSGDTYRIMV